jgi:hypothetical protein
MARAKASVSPACTTSPASPITSGSDELSAEITGVPQAIASSSGRPKPSYHDGKAKRAARL